MTEQEEPQENLFHQFGLREEILKAIDGVGYETPTPIQLKTIPILMSGQDLIGQAQTGTGKTAAFALPILQGLNLKQNNVQALVLVPTRELALQVSEAIHTYSKFLGTGRVLPIYGGQPIYRQISRLEAGVQIVVATPGRAMDHLRRGTLSFDALKIVVLDEADEMLRMGFLEDVDWILAQAPEGIQKALFSATMPTEVRRIADQYLKNPNYTQLEHKTITVPTIQQSYINVPEASKLDALTRILEAEQGSSILIFAHTKINTAEIAEKLQVRGYAAEAMHGDMSQAQREIVIKRLRSGMAEIVVATDVAARGLDVERITHVVNYDIPYDPESYVHRIGRTGRAGREGTAITFVTPRQQRLLRDIERFTGQRIEPMRVPTKADLAARRIALFKERVRKAIAEEDLAFYLSLIEDLVEEGFDIREVAAAAAHLAHADKPLESVKEHEQAHQDPDTMISFFLNVGKKSNVRPSDIVGAIANEGGIPGNTIGAIDIYDRYTLVDLPSRYKDQLLQRLVNTKIRNRPISIKIANANKDQGVAAPYQKESATYEKPLAEKPKKVVTPKVEKPFVPKSEEAPAPKLMFPNLAVEAEPFAAQKSREFKGDATKPRERKERKADLAQPTEYKASKSKKNLWEEKELLEKWQPKESWDNQENRETKDRGDFKDKRDPKDRRDFKDKRDAKDSRSTKERWDFKDRREAKDKRDFKDKGETRDKASFQENLEKRDRWDAKENWEPREKKERHKPLQTDKPGERSPRRGSGGGRSSAKPGAKPGGRSGAKFGARAGTKSGASFGKPKGKKR